MILHIPHSSTFIPPKYEIEFIIDIQDTLDILTDHFTDELFYYPNAKTIKFLLSRVICDVERFENNEKMEELYGMGVVYRKNHLGQTLHNMDKALQKEIIETYYRKHYEELEIAVSNELSKKEEALIVDCHSFHDEQALHVKDPHRPDICIGADEFHTPSFLIEAVVSYFKKLGYSVVINSPFEGTIVPMKYYKKDKKVSSIMIEVNRKLYLTKNYHKNKNFSKIQNLLKGSLDILECTFNKRDNKYVD